MSHFWPPRQGVAQMGPNKSQLLSSALCIEQVASNSQARFGGKSRVRHLQFPSGHVNYFARSIVMWVAYFVGNPIFHFDEVMILLPRSDRVFIERVFSLRDSGVRPSSGCGSCGRRALSARTCSRCNEFQPRLGSQIFTKQTFPERRSQRSCGQPRTRCLRVNMEAKIRGLEKPAIPFGPSSDTCTVHCYDHNRPVIEPSQCFLSKTCARDELSTECIAICGQGFMKDSSFYLFRPLS